MICNLKLIVTNSIIHRLLHHQIEIFYDFPAFIISILHFSFHYAWLAFQHWTMMACDRSPYIYLLLISYFSTNTSGKPSWMLHFPAMKRKMWFSCEKVSFLPFQRPTQWARICLKWWEILFNSPTLVNDVIVRMRWRILKIYDWRHMIITGWREKSLSWIINYFCLRN